MTDVLFHWLERIFQPMEHTFRSLEFIFHPLEGRKYRHEVLIVWRHGVSSRGRHNVVMAADTIVCVGVTEILRLVSASKGLNLFQLVYEVFACIAFRTFGDLFRSAADDHIATIIATLRP